ncbi:MAG: ECF transporter S component [Oscillospiraceae bacterium]|nr:ECF transporter S component [Oscillospiraceae bacterium]
MEQRRKNTPKSILLMSLAIVASVITLFLSWKLADRRYYLTGLLLMVYSMVPFFLMFETRRPQARELVVIAVLTALAVASRAAFIWAGHFKPMMAIIIITGIAFGPESGFLTGALAAFVSNFIFGQGAWTPYQMFAYGMSGWLAGICYQAGWLSKNRLKLAIFGFFTILLLVGPLLDVCAICLLTTGVNWQVAAATFASGFPVNLIHGLAVSLCLYFVSDALFEKLDRIKEKYGMMEG